MPHDVPGGSYPSPGGWACSLSSHPMGTHLVFAEGTLAQPVPAPRLGLAHLAPAPWAAAGSLHPDAICPRVPSATFLLVTCCAALQAAAHTSQALAGGRSSLFLPHSHPGAARLLLPSTTARRYRRAQAMPHTGCWGGTRYPSRSCPQPSVPPVLPCQSLAALGEGRARCRGTVPSPSPAAWPPHRAATGHPPWSSDETQGVVLAWDQVWGTGRAPCGACGSEAVQGRGTHGPRGPWLYCGAGAPRPAQTGLGARRAGV